MEYPENDSQVYDQLILNKRSRNKMWKKEKPLQQGTGKTLHHAKMRTQTSLKDK